jgi:hypothetical protein
MNNIDFYMVFDRFSQPHRLKPLPVHHCGSVRLFTESPKVAPYKDPRLDLMPRIIFPGQNYAVICAYRRANAIWAAGFMEQWCTDASSGDKVWYYDFSSLLNQAGIISWM